MTVKTIAKVKPAFPFEAYSHVISPIDAADGGGLLFTMPDIPGVMADGATEMEAIADGREAFIATVSAMVNNYLHASVGAELAQTLLGFVLTLAVGVLRVGCIGFSECSPGRRALAIHLD